MKTTSCTEKIDYPFNHSIKCGARTVDTYNKIQERLGLRANKQFTRKCDNDDFPVRGFALCPCCEKPFTASWSKGRNTRYPYYRCNSRNCNNTQKSIRKEIVEDHFD